MIDICKSWNSYVDVLSMVFDELKDKTYLEKAFFGLDIRWNRDEDVHTHNLILIVT